jgi:small multidrug resistance pump
MRKWLYLTVAIVLEATGTLCLHGALDHLALVAVVVAGYAGSFGCLALVLRAGAPVGVAYGIWAAASVALTAFASKVLFHESLTRTMALGMALVAVGVVLIELGAG